MCLAVPGKIVSLNGEPGMSFSGLVDFSGIQKKISLACIPDVAVGDYVIVHVGMALSKIDEAEAQEIFHYLREIGELQEIEEAPA